MKAKTKISLTALLLLCNVVSPVWADQPPSKTDAEAFQKLRKIVASRPFYFKDYSESLPGEAAFCNGFMRDLMAGKAIRVLEPYYRTDDIGNRALARWRNCDHSNNIVQNFIHRPTIGMRGFRLYRVDADNNVSNGLEEVLYSEFDFKEKAGPAGFYWWDLNMCQLRGGSDAEQDDKRDLSGNGTLGDSYALLISYTKMTWVLKMHGLGMRSMKSLNDVWGPPEDYHLAINGLPIIPDGAHRSRFRCSWSTLNRSTAARAVIKSVK